jgi:hypothetical protein
LKDPDDVPFEFDVACIVADVELTELLSGFDFVLFVLANEFTRDGVLFHISPYEKRVSCVNFSESFFISAFVRMMNESKFPIGSLDFFNRCGGRNVENGVS